MPVSPPSFGRLLLVTVISTAGAGTFTARADTGALFVECIGAGGSGAGVAASGATTNAACGVGGQGGGYAFIYLTTNIGSHSYTVGAGGAATAAGANNGVAGGDTIFRNSLAATVCLAPGGHGGDARLAGAATVGMTFSTATGTAIVGTSGEFGMGGYCIRLSGAYSATFAGAAANGAEQVVSMTSAASQGISAVAGSSPGGGGLGGLDTANVARAGGKGGDGLIRVFEYA